MTGGASAGEFAVFSEAVRRPGLSAPWLEYLQTWFAVDGGDPPGATSLLLVWLAANGLWIAESTGILTLDHDRREALVAALLALLPAEENR
jgi:hypothetical protein